MRHKGFKHTEETKIKIGLANKGNTSWLKGTKGLIKSPFKGIPRSDEVKKKISQSRMGVVVRKGFILSAEHRKRISEAKTGKKCPNASGAKSIHWKGGVTPINQRIRTSIEYRQWRLGVFKRDNYTCTECGSRSGNGKAVVLNADHIKPFAYYPELRFLLENGRTLCVECHRKTNTYASRVKKYEIRTSA